MESIWAANKPHWRDLASCKDANPELFSPVIETDDRLALVQEDFCNGCPVKGSCLNSAIIHNDSGFWGGTSSAHRRAMRRTRSRSKCPLCNSENLVRVPHGEEGDSVTWYEVCVSCAASWKADERPTPRQAAAEKTLHRPVPVAEVTEMELYVPRLKGRNVKTVPLTEDAASCL